MKLTGGIQLRLNLMVLAGWLIVVMPAPASAQQAFNEIGLAEAMADSSASTAFPFEIQTGMLFRLGGSEVRHGKSSYLLVGNFDYLSTQEPGWAFGGGARVIADDDGHRYGLRGVVRRRFEYGRIYALAAPWLALGGHDNHRTLRWPGYGAELELGQEDWLAVTLGLEVVRYRDYQLSNNYSGLDVVTVTQKKGTEVSWYLGGKLNGPIKSFAWLLSLVVVAAATLGETS